MDLMINDGDLMKMIYFVFIIYEFVLIILLIHVFQVHLHKL